MVLDRHDLEIHVLSSAEEKLMQWHQRLGHHSLIALENLFLISAKNCDLKTLLCDACEFAEHIVSLVLLAMMKVLLIFCYSFRCAGPSRVVSLSGHRWFVSFIFYFSRTTWVFLMNTKRKLPLASRDSGRWPLHNLTPRLEFPQVMRDGVKRSSFSRLFA